MASIPVHHIRGEECMTRPAYREGRRATAVKVYTIHQESRHLMVTGVPEVGGGQELVALCGQYGAIESHRLLADYPTEPFTEAYLFSYRKIQSARIAKRKLDDQNFLGGMLHVFYAPEYETVDDVRSKLIERRKVVAFKIRQHEAEQRAEAQLLDRLPTDVSKVISADYQGSLSRSNHTPALMANGSSKTAPPPQPDPAKDPRTWVEAVQEQPRSARSQDTGTWNGSGDPMVPPHSWQDSRAGSVRKAITLGTDSPDLQPSASLLAQEESLLAFHQSLRLPAPAAEERRSVVNKAPQPKAKFPRVQSSHATLPRGYDGRLPGHAGRGGAVSSLQGRPEAGRDEEGSTDGDRPVLNGTANHRHEDTTKQGGKSAGTPVCKHFQGSKKLLALVPRQAVKQKTGDSTSKPNGVPGGCYVPPVPKDDALSERLRKEALVLSEPQGPVSAEGKDAKCSIPTSAEKSVQETVQHVRKRLSEIISEAVPKKRKSGKRDSAVDSKR